MVDKLKPEVRDAVGRMARAAGDIGEPFYARHKDYDTIRAELMRLAEENARLATDADDQREATGDLVSRLERAESELAALKRRIEESPVVECPLDKPTTEDGWLQVIEWAKGVKWTKGKRVILLLDDGEIPVTPAA